MNLLLDANVYIDYIGRKAPYFSDAQKIIMACFFGDVRLWLPSQSATDAFYVLSKYIDGVKLQKAMSKSFELIHMVSLTGEDVRGALQLGWDDLEDCLIAISAQKANADFIVTRNAGDFVRSSIPAIAPADWVKMMKDERGLAYGEESLKP